MELSYGIFVVCLVAYTIVGTTHTTIYSAYGSTLPLIIFLALKYMLSCSFFTYEPKALPSSTMFFLLIIFLGESIIAFKLFSNAIYISSLIFKTWLVVFMDSPFDAQIDIERFLPIPIPMEIDLCYPFYSP